MTKMDERAINKRQMKLYAEANRYPASELSNKVKVINLIEENILRKRLDIFEKQERRSLKCMEKESKEIEADLKELMLTPLHFSDHFVGDENSEEDILKEDTRKRKKRRRQSKQQSLVSGNTGESQQSSLEGELQKEDNDREINEGEGESKTEHDHPRNGYEQNGHLEDGHIQNRHTRNGHMQNGHTETPGDHTTTHNEEESYDDDYDNHDGYPVYKDHQEENVKHDHTSQKQHKKHTQEQQDSKRTPREQQLEQNKQKPSKGHKHPQQQQQQHDASQEQQKRDANIHPSHLAHHQSSPKQSEKLFVLVEEDDEEFFLPSLKNDSPTSPPQRRMTKENSQVDKKGFLPDIHGGCCSSKSYPSLIRSNTTSDRPSSKTADKLNRKTFSLPDIHMQKY